MKYSWFIGSILLAFGLLTQARQPPDPFLDNLFSVDGVTWDEKQQVQVDALKEKYVPQLLKFQKDRASIPTDVQRKSRQQIMREGREQGLSKDEIIKQLQSTGTMTPAQQDLLRASMDAQRKLTRTIREELFRIAKIDRKKPQRNAQHKTPPTHADVKYGPHERNVMDLWTVESDQPTPVLVSIHGGGFRAGNKSIHPLLLQACLEQNIAVVTLTYRFSQDAMAPASFLDCARAIQFIRHNAKTWNIDPTRMVSTGGSAGAGLSLWLGFHDDLANADSEDPVLRHSTRLSGMAVYNGQTSYDPRFIQKLFPEFNVYDHEALRQLYDADLSDLDSLPKEKYTLFEQVSALPHLTKDDAPAILFYGNKMSTEVTNHSIGIHHPRFGKALKKEMDQLGIYCKVYPGVSRNSETFVNTIMDFLVEQFKE